MPFKPPINSSLTENQSQALSKFGAMKTFLSTSSKKKDNFVPKSQQISTYDFLIKMAYSAIGPAIIDILLKSFFDKLFDKGSKKLENMVIKSIAASLDKSGTKLSNSQSNEEWLKSNISPTFNLAKDVLALMLITMIFGPKKKMDEYVEKSDPSGDVNGRKANILDSAVCSSQTFTLTNNPSVPQGDLEYNKIQLRRQLEQGNVEFIISCQTVKVKLPEQLEQTLKSETVSNPADIFSNLNNYVSQEIIRQNVPENSNAVNKTFYQTINEKTFQLLPTAIAMQMGPVFDLINVKAKSQNPSFTPITVESVISSPCEIVNSDSTSASFKQKSVFYSTFLNILYAFLISILFNEITNQLKKMIKNIFAESARRKAEKKIRKQQMRFKFLDKAGNALEKAKMYEEAMKGISVINSFIKGI
jgi:hypothetical protein